MRVVRPASRSVSVAVTTAMASLSLAETQAETAPESAQWRGTCGAGSAGESLSVTAGPALSRLTTAPASALLVTTKFATDSFSCKFK